jgi:hypothetical protein
MEQREFPLSEGRPHARRTRRPTMRVVRPSRARRRTCSSPARTATRASQPGRRSSTSTSIAFASAASTTSPEAETSRCFVSPCVAGSASLPLLDATEGADGGACSIPRCSTWLRAACGCARLRRSARDARAPRRRKRARLRPGTATTAIRPGGAPPLPPVPPPGNRASPSSTEPSLRVGVWGSGRAPPSHRSEIISARSRASERRSRS